MAKSDSSAKMPSHVDDGLSLFDRFATYASERVSKAWFFGICAVLVLIWVPTFWLWPSFDGWALVINTFTSTITFLLVALLQNTETRAENATQRKLNAIADALADLMDELGADNPDLHRSQVPLSKEQFKAVVHDSALRDGGMASFARYLDVKDMEPVRAFLIQVYLRPSSRN